jgi:hypothetical protein
MLALAVTTQVVNGEKKMSIVRDYSSVSYYLLSIASFGGSQGSRPLLFFVLVMVQENAPELAKPPASSVLLRIPDRLKCVGVEVEAMVMDMDLQMVKHVPCSPTAVFRAHKSQFSSPQLISPYLRHETLHLLHCYY